MEAKISVSDPETLKKRLLDKCRALDMNEMTRDVGPFLFGEKDNKKVVMFDDLVRQYSF